MEIQRMQISTLPEGRETFGNDLASLTGPRDALPGCLSCRILHDWHDRTELLVEIDWESKEDLLRYLRSAVYKQLLLLIELSPRPPVIQFFTVTELRGLDLVREARDPEPERDPEPAYQGKQQGKQLGGTQRKAAV